MAVEKKKKNIQLLSARSRVVSQQGNVQKP